MEQRNQIKKDEYRYSELTGNIIGCAMNVHSELGNGFREIIYQRALSREFGIRKLSFEQEISMPVYYRETNIGFRRVDFLVEGKVLVELKAVSEINNQHISQVLNYLKAYNLEVALLLNFGEKSLNFKRIVSLKK